MKMKSSIIATASFLLIVFPIRVVSSEPLWVTPSNIKYRNIEAKDRIIPIGFSRKGVFAYILQENSCRGAVDSYQKVSWISIDLVNDKIVERIDLGREAPDVPPADVLRKYAQKIEHSNSQYGIATTESYRIAISTVIKLGGDVLTIQMDLIETVEGEDAINPGYQKYQISLLSENKGIKTLAEIKSVYEPLHYWGYYKSPYEERIAVLLLSDFRGCGAYPQMRINIVGANLIRGFNVERGD